MKVIVTTTRFEWKPDGSDLIETIELNKSGKWGRRVYIRATHMTVLINLRNGHNLAATFDGKADDIIEKYRKICSLITGHGGVAVSEWVFLDSFTEKDDSKREGFIGTIF